MSPNAVFPSSFYFPAAETVSVNGSSAVGQCSDVTTGLGDRTMSRCNTPCMHALAYCVLLPNSASCNGNYAWVHSSKGSYHINPKGLGLPMSTLHCGMQPPQLIHWPEQLQFTTVECRSM
jgi:hypothetical protein